MKYNIPTFIAILIGILLVFITFRGLSKPNGDYSSLEIRKLPNGNVLQRTVSENNGNWIREVKLLDSNGSVINVKSKEIHPVYCEKIKAGIFVPKLWEDDGALGCLSSSS